MTLPRHLGREDVRAAKSHRQLAHQSALSDRQDAVEMREERAPRAAPISAPAQLIGIDRDRRDWGNPAKMPVGGVGNLLRGWRNGYSRRRYRSAHRRKTRGAPPPP